MTDYNIIDWLGTVSKVPKRRPRGVCPVCNNFTDGAGSCTSCGYQAGTEVTQEARKAYVKKLLSLPKEKRSYRDLTAKDMTAYSSGRVRKAETERDFFRLFGNVYLIKDRDAFPTKTHLKVWLQLMIAYELQRRLVYPQGEPERVRKRRQKVRRGTFPADYYFMGNE